MMDTSGSGDFNAPVPTILSEGEKVEETKFTEDTALESLEEPTSDSAIPDDVTSKTIEDQESRLKSRISQCRSIIESLKLELSEEKTKLSNEAKEKSAQLAPAPVCSSSFDTSSTSDKYNADYGEMSFASSMYSACVESKLGHDDNLLQYEKQLQQYQNTLNMAHVEKKNAIRKQMLAKAFRLKLQEVENQCNIELLRLKQSMQLLEPLQMIASNWKVEEDPFDPINLQQFQLTMPQYPELGSSSHSEKYSALTAASEKDQGMGSTELEFPGWQNLSGME